MALPLRAIRIDTVEIETIGTGITRIRSIVDHRRRNAPLVARASRIRLGKVRIICAFSDDQGAVSRMVEDAHRCRSHRRAVLQLYFAWLLKFKRSAKGGRSPR